MEMLTATPIERDVVLVSGADAADYLQTQLTQDVVALEDGASTWSFLLTPKSEIIAVVRVTRHEDTMLIDVEPSWGQAVLDRIDGLLFRMDVSFALEKWTGVAWRGPGAADVSADAPVVSQTPWPGIEGVDVVGPDVSVPDGAEERSLEALDAMRVLSGWPAMGSEIEGSATPAMTGLVDSMVSFTKGCYTGQEFVARVHYRDAAPPKRLVRVRFHPCAAVESGSAIEVDGETVGAITSVSACSPVALGYLKRSVELPQSGTCAKCPADFEAIAAG
jgi:folate-binding protein YgfZ